MRRPTLNSTKTTSRTRQYLTRFQAGLNKSAQNLQQQLSLEQRSSEELQRESSRATSFMALAAKFRPSIEDVRASESVAQEYARTIKALWQMVEEEELSQRLADASPEEREWIIMHHSNLSETSTLASCYLIPNHTAVQTNTSRDHLRYSRESNATDDSRNHSCNNKCNNSRLGHADPAHSYNKNHYTHHTQSDHHQYQSYQLQPPPLSPICEAYGSPLSETGTIELVPHQEPVAHQPHHATVVSRPSFQESRRVHPYTQVTKEWDADSVHSADHHHTIQRSSTRLSYKAKQSAMELQKRDHYTVQQRIDLEEDWRLKAKLLQANGACVGPASKRRSQPERASYYTVRVDEDGYPEYEPEKQEVDEDEDVYEAALMERGRLALEELEQQLGLYGLQRYDHSDSGTTVADGEELHSKKIVEPEELAVLSVAHKVGVVAYCESPLVYHTRGSRQLFGAV
ncbi:hypothetical protein BGX29_012052 [Mortierella sp. GBA35]|nr:hypothetical protein BGX29_012052 [Mortierella sp. GBA35]